MHSFFLTSHYYQIAHLTLNQFHMRTIELADPSFIVSSAIELILGSDVAEEIILDGKFTGTNGLHYRNSFRLDCFRKATESKLHNCEHLSLYQRLF